MLKGQFSSERPLVRHRAADMTNRQWPIVTAILDGKVLAMKPEPVRLDAGNGE
jgi:hypothetical protein